jgi:hypothetical protein
MVALEWVSERPEDVRLRRLFQDILKTLGPPSLPGEYRALALWPEYLEAAWERLKPWMGREEFQQACERVRQVAEQRARELPYRVELPRLSVEGLYTDVEKVVRVTEQFEKRLPLQVVNVALLAQEVPELELRRPFATEEWRGEQPVGTGGLA